MVVAAQFDPSDLVAGVAGILGVGSQHSFLQADEAVDHLEHRARRLCGLDGPVEHRLVGVVYQFRVVLVDFGQLGYVDAGAGHHCENLSGRGLDGHNRTHLVLHQLLAVGLQVQVDGGRNVCPADGFLVVGSVLIVLLDAVVSVAQEDFEAFLAFETVFEGHLHSGLACEITHHIAFVVLQEILVHLADVAQQVSAGIDGVVARSPYDRVEAGEHIALLGEFVVHLAGNLLEEGNGSVAYAAAVAAVIVEALLDELLVEVEYLAEGEGVEGLYVDGSHFEVIDDLVVDHYLPVAVEDASAGGIVHLVFQRVVLGVDAVFVFNYLHVEQPAYDCEESNRYRSEENVLSADG